MSKNKILPELLAPAGSPEALRAAIAGGADAVYFGGTDFNARIRAQNFGEEEMRDCIALCHAHGVRAYVTFNTLVTDREMPAFLEAAKTAYRHGADALIVADAGCAEVLRQAMPDLPLHASTQCSAHSVSGVRELAARGFCRVVPARELPREELARLVRESGVEIEMFVHGALCVSHSGQCLFSSLVGGRSGNRGSCAQPCRLPDAKGSFPLSLKDLCLAREIPALIEMGVHSLKIEGRLKSPAYVGEVTAIYRHLLDEGRAANDREIAALAAAFSRSGFTDGYFKGNISHRMMGIRSDADKQRARDAAPAEVSLAPAPLSLSFTMREGQPVSLTLRAAEKEVTVRGDIPQKAIRAPMTREAVLRSLTRFGGTPYSVKHAEIDLDEGLMLPVSALNALRREAVTALCATGRDATLVTLPAPARAAGKRISKRSARFHSAAQITPAAIEYFPLRYLPLYTVAQADVLPSDAAGRPLANGVVLPAVIFSGEEDAVRAQLQKAAQRGIKHALVGNVGHLALAREAGLIPHGDFRLNLCNEQALAKTLERGFADALLSPELSLPQVRDIGGACDCIVYGRVPLMLLEKCAGREVGSCEACEDGTNALVDRRGEVFPLLRLPPHRNILYNSRPTAMSDKQAELAAAKITAGHFIFSTEAPAQVDAVIKAYQTGAPIAGPVRRI